MEARKEEEKKLKVLCSGLGGGLDVVNASILYYLAKSNGVDTILGSARPAPISSVENSLPFAKNGTLLTGDSKIHQKGRYIEPRVAEEIKEQVVFLSRIDGPGTPPGSMQDLKEAVIAARETFGFTHMIFIDGGGDSLILQTKDGCNTSETTDPFLGGDAETLRALRGIPNVYQAIVAVGLDVDVEGFKNNVKLLKERGGYYGRINLHTGESEDYTFSHVLNWNGKLDFLEAYFKLAESVVVLESKDNKDKKKMQSHTATVTYHALKGNWGPKRTFVPWEPRLPDGSKGVDIQEPFAWMYFFDATAVEDLKLELNGKKDY